MARREHKQHYCNRSVLRSGPFLQEAQWLLLLLLQGCAGTVRALQMSVTCMALSEARRRTAKNVSKTQSYWSPAASRCVIGYGRVWADVGRTKLRSY